MNKFKLIVFVFPLVMGWISVKAQKMMQLIPAKKFEYHLKYSLLPARIHEPTALDFCNQMYHVIPLVQPIKSAVKYDAFFCNMEIENLQRFNLWIKIHAGDYDHYTKPNF